VLSLTDGVVLRWGAKSGAATQITGGSPLVLVGLQAELAMENGLYLATGFGAQVKGMGAQVFDPWKDDPAGFGVGRGVSCRLSVFSCQC